jgi:hypothetical protein
MPLHFSTRHFSELRQDIQYGCRMLRQSPAFTTVGLVSVALGICVATCAYSELHGLILRDIPCAFKPDELAGVGTPISYPSYKRFSSQTNIFSSTMP